MYELQRWPLIHQKQNIPRKNRKPRVTKTIARRKEIWALVSSSSSSSSSAATVDCSGWYNGWASRQSEMYLPKKRYNCMYPFRCTCLRWIARECKDRWGCQYEYQSVLIFPSAQSSILRDTRVPSLVPGITLGSLRFTELSWVGKHVNAILKPTNSPTQG